MIALCYDTLVVILYNALPSPLREKVEINSVSKSETRDISGGKVRLQYVFI